MEQKKVPLNGIIQDALKSMDIDSNSQKAINLRTTDKSRKIDRIANSQKADNLPEVFEASIIPNKIPDNNFLSKEDNIKWFSEISNKDIKIVGGKGASLGEMFNRKFPVPLGFVITAQAFEYFLKTDEIKQKIDQIISEINIEDTEELNRASKEIRKIIESQKINPELKSEILESYHILGSEKIDKQRVSQNALHILRNSQEPIFVSVRSSATTEDLADASFAGQHESFLNIKGDTQLLEHVKKCFSSLYTPRAIYYRNKKGFKEEDSLLAVVVQKMIDSEKSGVVFSRNPVGDENEVAVEAVFGLGEGIVSGQIKPDNYIVSRDLKIKDKRISDKKIAIVRSSSGENTAVRLSYEKSRQQVLTNGEILEIADYAVKLEEHYRKPQDIEFALESGEIYIVQSRPITTLNKKKHGAVISGNIILQGQSASPGVGAGVVRIINTMQDLNKIKKGEVLVTEMTNPDMVVAMQKSSAIITDEGGMTSHAAIVSREMGIPCIVGTETATKVLKDGMRITVDGTSGNIYEGEVAETHAVEIKSAIKNKRIKLKLIVDLPDFAERAAQTEIDSVGLTRLEGIIASSRKHPLLYEKQNSLNQYTQLLEEGIAKIIEHFKSIWIRASDIRTDEYSSLEGAPEIEVNPMLGFHGIRFGLKHPKILEAELLAIKNIAIKNPDKKIGIMFPQVISIEEVQEAKRYFNKFRTENMEFGVMIETPASVQIIDDICKEVDFVSLGTNDLTQFTLGVDRGNEDVQFLYNELHPSIFKQINKVISSCRANNVESSICGQAGSKKEMVEFLFRKGISSISVNADAAYEISQYIQEHENEYENIKQGGEIKRVNNREENERRAMQDETEKRQRDIQRENNRERVDNYNQDSQDRNQLTFEEKRRLKKKQKWEKWKEKKRKWKEEKKIEIREKWDKKAEFAPDENYPEETPEKFHINREGLLNKNNIRTPAEFYEPKNQEQKKDNSVEFVNDLERIKEKAEDIHKSVEKQNIEEVKEDEIKESSIEVDFEEVKEAKEDLGSDDEIIETIGVYNPDEEKTKPKQSYSYNFDDD